ncbi:RSP_7527 family protein [Azospirillum picis]|uniref:Transposase n=1 Tax=Azospirillum picis TaxID=488438 RepID=A0ABU0MGL6_9PROT|nr:hypothetical protein [Azospirillum picis]MBP2298400.1 hypothetical protein [Azospirillum picis]MDQ0532551.1 hypothetical protein [Azospirillum picis]
MSKMLLTEDRDVRTHDEIMMAARRMRAEYLRELFGKLRNSLFGGRAAHPGPALTPSAR